MAIMTLFVGYIFSDVFTRFTDYSGDVLGFRRPGLDLEAFKFAALVTAPGLILHELSHKFIALGFGMQATFHAAYAWLIFGLILKLVNFGFIVFVPAFVSITGTGNPLQFSVIAFAGPAMNLSLWLGTGFAMKKNLIAKKHLKLAFLTKEINKFLFIFNMIPFPGFDGYQVFSGLLKTIL